MALDDARELSLKAECVATRKAGSAAAGRTSEKAMMPNLKREAASLRCEACGT